MSIAVEKKFSSFATYWYVWIFPFIAILLSGWIFFKYFRERGPEIQIVMADASGIEPQKTQIRFRGMNVGHVTKVTLSESGREVIVHATLLKENARLAVQSSKFWVVRPRVDLQGVSGLDTLLEGVYIGVAPGSRNGPSATHFVAQERGPIKIDYENTVTYYVESENVESVSLGTFVTYRGMRIGTVSDIKLSRLSEYAVIQINIQKKFVNLIRTNTEFWQKAAVSATFGLFKSEVTVNSFDTIMRGGVALATPTRAGAIANAESIFILREKAPENWEFWRPDLRFPKRGPQQDDVELRAPASVK